MSFPLIDFNCHVTEDEVFKSNKPRSETWHSHPLITLIGNCKLWKIVPAAASSTYVAPITRIVNSICHHTTKGHTKRSYKTRTQITLACWRRFEKKTEIVFPRIAVFDSISQGEKIDTWMRRQKASVQNYFHSWEISVSVKDPILTLKVTFFASPREPSTRSTSRLASIEITTTEKLQFSTWSKNVN